jgi:hypothetical protein
MSLPEGLSVLRYPTPRLPTTFSTNESNSESVAQESEAEEEDELAHVELAEHLNKLFIEDKRFFGLAR